jgi:hypothetical protein
MWVTAAHHLRRMSKASKSALKICATRGRQISWRKKWDVCFSLRVLSFLVIVVVIKKSKRLSAFQLYHAK